MSAGYVYLAGDGGDWEPGWNAQFLVSNGAEVVIGRWDLNGYDVDPGSNVQIYRGGTLDVSNGGCVYVGEGTDPCASNPTPEFQAGAVILGFDGVIDSTGTIDGDVLNHGGMFHPGHSTGTATIQGDFIQTGGSLVFDVGPADYSILDVSGKTEIAGGTIVFEKFGIGGIVAGDMVFFTNGVTIGDGVDIVISSDLEKYGFTFNRSTGVGYAPVPEPASMVVLGLGLAWLVRRQRSRR